MRTVHWLFVVSAALFISGVAFVVAAGRVTQEAAVHPAPTQAGLTPVASVRQIMNGITGPAAMEVFASVGSVISYQGTTETAPQTALDWEKVGNSAMALVESGNLLMLGSRAVDNGDWMKMSRDMMEAAKVAGKAIEAQDSEGLLLSGEAINTSCDNCHQRYWR